MKHVDTPSYLKELKKHTGTILEYGKTKVVNIQLRKGETMPEHKFSGDVLVIVRSGKVTFTANSENIELSPQALLYFEPDELHDMKAEEDADLIVVQTVR